MVVSFRKTALAVTDDDSHSSGICWLSLLSYTYSIVIRRFEIHDNLYRLYDTIVEVEGALEKPSHGEVGSMEWPMSRHIEPQGNASLLPSRSTIVLLYISFHRRYNVDFISRPSRLLGVLWSSRTL